MQTVAVVETPGGTSGYGTLHVFAASTGRQIWSLAGKRAEVQLVSDRVRSQRIGLFFFNISSTLYTLETRDMTGRYLSETTRSPERAYHYMPWTTSPAIDYFWTVY
jgi:hypothetical protein